MAQRPDDRMVRVELVEDDGPDPAAPGLDATEPRDARDTGAASAAPAVPAAARSRVRRALALVAAVAAVAAVATVAVAIRGGDRPVAVAGPGLVMSLDRPLHQLWQTSTGEVLGHAHSVVVLAREEFGQRGAVALDQATGADLWSMPLGRTADADICSSVVTVDPPAVWCWRYARVVADASSGDSVLAGAALLRLGLSDGLVNSEWVMRVPSAGLGAFDDDLILAERVDENVTVDRLDPSALGTVWSTEIELLPRSYLGDFDARMRVEAGFVIIGGPTSVVLDAADGAVIAYFEPVDDPRVLTLDGAEIVATDQGFAAWYQMDDGFRTARGVWYDTSGTPVAEFDGALAEPDVSDGSSPDVVLVSRDERLVALEEPGTVLWSTDLGDGVVLQRHDGTVVVAQGDQVTAMELATGIPRWSAVVAGLRPASGAVSDGRSLVVMAVQGQRWVLEALSLSGGERLWFATAPGAPEPAQPASVGTPVLEAVGTHAVIRSGRTLTWLG